MKYIVYAMTLSFLVACGNQDHTHAKKAVHLLNEKVAEPISLIEHPIEKPTAVMEEDNEREAPHQNERDNSIKIEENSSISIAKEPIIEEENLSVVMVPIVEKREDVVSKQEQNSTSILVPSSIEPKINNAVDPLKLAAIEAKMKKELLSLKIQHEQSLKSMELAIKKSQALQAKEIALAKLSHQKEIEKIKASDEKELAASKLDIQQKIEMAKIASQKELDAKQKAIEEAKAIQEKEVALAKLQTQKELAQRQEAVDIAQAKRDKEVALATLHNSAMMSDKQLEFYKMIAMIVTGLIVLGLLILYFIVQRKRKNELKLQENELQHQAYLEASKQHNEHVKKMLEIITDENMDKGIKKEMMRLLKDQSSQANLIEHKK